MRRTCTTISLVALVLACLAMPASASASHVSRSDFKSASSYCKALRAELGAKAFKREFRAKKVRGAHRRCVRRNRAVRALAPVDTFPTPAETITCTPTEEPQPVRAFAAEPCPQPAPVVADPEDEDDDQGEDDDEDADYQDERKDDRDSEDERDDD